MKATDEQSPGKEARLPVIDHGMRSTRPFDVKDHDKTCHCTCWPRASAWPTRSMYVNTCRDGQSIPPLDRRRRRRRSRRRRDARAGFYLLFCVGNKSTRESVSFSPKHRTTSHEDLPGKCSLAYCSQAFAGLPTFCPITFHLLFSYSLMAENNAAFWRAKSARARREGSCPSQAARTSSSANSA